MDNVPLATALANPIAVIIAVAFVVFVAGVVMMRLAKGREQWVDTAAVLQGSGGSVFVGLMLTFFMA